MAGASSWCDGLPYAMYDLRPQDYPGRQLGRDQHRPLADRSPAVSPNAEDGSDDDVAFALSRCGADMSRKLILGNPAFELWQGSLTEAPRRSSRQAWAAPALRLLPHRHRRKPRPPIPPKGDIQRDFRG